MNNVDQIPRFNTRFSKKIISVYSLTSAGGVVSFGSFKWMEASVTCDVSAAKGQKYPYVLTASSANMSARREPSGGTAFLKYIPEA